MICTLVFAGPDVKFFIFAPNVLTIQPVQYTDYKDF